MKKVLSVLVLLLVAVLLVACGEEVYEIAMITDVGDIDDKSFNQGTWEGIEAWATENGKSHKYYKPSTGSMNDYVAAIDLAVSAGAKIVITPGYLFENAIHKVQYIYPDVKFVIIDGSPHNVINFETEETYDGKEPNFDIEDNTYSIFFKEHESGFFAGYAAYKDGKTSLAFLGGLPVPAVIRFGIGYVAGAYYAADEANNDSYAFDIANNYEYAPSGFAPSDDVVNWASARYSAGVDAIFAAAGGAGQSVFQAASTAGSNKWGIGVDVDQGAHSKVLTSAMKGLGVAVKDALNKFYDDDFPGGESVNLGASDDAVGLPTVEEHWRFASFTLEQYNAIHTKVANGTVVVPEDTTELATFITGLGYTVPQGMAAKINGE